MRLEVDHILKLNLKLGNEIEPDFACLSNE